ncbi:non-ribosomal peptide synthetase [Fischerella thermalis]|uniref:non-ribosomal peptide synthetase n=3 Tax=Fischerella thermalis TaxID=372787 RepID=UPI001A0FAE97|nr:amino acid adenylation domain-containing protein [Fischerella thermalis]MBF2061118.1 amino acid adenylation domain-containing protein [Fischerella thermalis M66_A2018_004]
MRDLYQQIAELSPDQRALFEKRLQQKGLSSVKISRISHRKDSDSLPLSFAQQRLWFIQQLDPDNSAYNVFSALRIQGQLNVAVLEQTFTEIVRRHETLRTTFTTNASGEPIQVITPPQPVTLPIMDLTEVSNLEEEVHQLIVKEAQQPFDLTKPLLRLTLVRLDAAEHVLLLTVHHIICDRWSMGIFVREMKALYEAFVNSKPSPLPELPIQYADWAIWQRQWLQGQVLEEQLNYWQKQLQGNLPVLKLPSDRPRPVVPTYRGSQQSLVLSKPLSDALKDLSKKEGVTLFTLLLTAFNILLCKYTHQDDIIVGTDIANRNRVETEGLIGFLINTLVLRTSLSGNPSFRELLHRVREVMQGAYAHQDLPFEKLVEELNPERTLSQMTPLFQVKFDLQLAQVEPPELSDLTVIPLAFDNGTAKFELRFNLSDTEQGITGLVEYSTDLFNDSTITRMVQHFQTLLSGIVANPEQRLEELPLLSEAEQQQLLVEWNDTETEYPNQCIHQLFAAQVERTPDAVAVVFQDEQLTYTQLNQRANQLAHYLQKLGVKPEVLVGICLPRSIEMLVGLLAILKAGGAYVPIDPAYPQQRLALMLEDAQVSVLLTSVELAAQLPEHRAKVVCLDADWEKINKQSIDNPINKASTENLAYVIYTSGSTGRPKGVQIPHSAVVNFLSTMRQTPGLTQDDILLSVTTLSFDIAALELYLPLIVGARLIIVSREIASDGIQLSKQLDLHQANVMQATPATWRLLLGAGWQGSKQLKILCGGETLNRSVADQLLERSKQVWNLYGPTETTIWSAVQIVENKTEQTDSIVSIGRPIANTQFYVLDQHQHLVPIGVPGELYIGGAGVARGYLNRPELTAEKFIPNPFHKEAGGRLYKTGDLVRLRSDSSIEFLGRIDNQVKLRGFRIELGEIEALLNQYPGVETSIALIREDEPGSQRLVAYVLPQPNQTLTIPELRHFLKSKLPNYMVPTAFVTLEALPLTPNGKVDRKALPAPDQTRPELETTYQPPQNEIEQTIANIWQEVLHVKEVGIYDNFFELGGQSLLLVQVHSKLQKILPRDLSLVEMFQYPTISSLAKYLNQEQNQPAALTKDSYRTEVRTASIKRRREVRQNYRKTT